MSMHFGIFFHGRAEEAWEKVTKFSRKALAASSGFAESGQAQRREADWPVLVGRGRLVSPAALVHRGTCASVMGLSCCCTCGPCTMHEGHR